MAKAENLRTCVCGSFQNSPLIIVHSTKKKKKNYNNHVHGREIPFATVSFLLLFGWGKKSRETSIMADY